MASLGTKTEFQFANTAAHNNDGNLLLVCFGWGSNGTTYQATVTFNDVAMTCIAGIAGGGRVCETSEAFYLLNAPTGTYDVVISGEGDGVPSGWIQSVKNARGAPEGSVFKVGNDGFSTVEYIDVPGCDAGDLVFLTGESDGWSNPGWGYTVGTGLTQLHNQRNYNGDDRYASHTYGCYKEAQYGTETMYFTRSGGDSWPYTVIGFIVPGTSTGFLPASLRLLNGSLTFIKKAAASGLPANMGASPVVFSMPYEQIAIVDMTSADFNAALTAGNPVKLNTGGAPPKDGKVIVGTKTGKVTVEVKGGTVKYTRTYGY